MATIPETAKKMHEKAAGERIPPLQNGDRLSRDEFERRYLAMPRLKKAELIDGVVYMPSPVIFVDHGGPHFDLIAWLGTYRMFTPGVRGGDNSTVRLDLTSVPQPDTCLLVLPTHGGRVTIDQDGYIVGGPEFAGEVAATSANYDVTVKLPNYQRNGVQEYLIWRVLDRAIDWFRLRGGQYAALLPGSDGIVRSEVFPGLWLDPAALIAGDMEAVLRVVQQGIASPEHAAFVAKLKLAAETGASS